MAPSDEEPRVVRSEADPVPDGCEFDMSGSEEEEDSTVYLGQWNPAQVSGSEHRIG